MNEDPNLASEGPHFGRLLTVAEVAHRLKVANVSVYRLLRSGRLPGIKAAGGYRVREDDVRKFLEDRFKDAG